MVMKEFLFIYSNTNKLTMQHLISIQSQHISTKRKNIFTLIIFFIYLLNS